MKSQRGHQKLSKTDKESEGKYCFDLFSRYRFFRTIRLLPHYTDNSKFNFASMLLYLILSVFFRKAVEHVGIAPQGKGGQFWEAVYKKNPGKENPLNINTHGGLMHFGAPGSAAALCILLTFFFICFNICYS